jgi:hypothetical protein
VTVERDSHPEKDWAPSVSTEEGMQIDESDEQFRNAPSAIDDSLEPGSNVTVERCLHSEKHLAPRSSTDEGRQIDESDEQLKNADSSRRQSREPDSHLTFRPVS